MGKRRHGSRRKDGAREPNGRLQRRPDPGPEGVPLHRSAAGNGQVVADYWGSDELERSRLREKMRRDGAWRANLEHPLGVCRERGLISEAEYLAGQSYAEDHLAIDMQRREKSCLASSFRTTASPPPPSGSSEAEARRESRYLRAREALMSAGTRAAHIVQNVALYGRWPRFLDQRKRTSEAWTADRRDVEALRHGLQALLNVYHHRGGGEDDTVDLAR